MNSMFLNCPKLTKIYVGNNWSTAKLKGSTDMFKDSILLSGAVSYDSSKVDASMANTTTGYLTLKG